MESFTGTVGFGRGIATKDVFQNSSCPPTPSIDVNNKSNVASGRAAQVLRQIKQSNLTKDLSENQLLLRCTISSWHKYAIEFQPILLSRTARFTHVNQLSKHFEGIPKLYDGDCLYLPQPLAKETLVFNNTSDESANEIRLQFLETISFEQIPMKLINLLFRFAIDQGRELLFQRNRHKTRQWNGQIVDLERRDDGLLITFDFPQKTPPMTCYEDLEHFYMTTTGTSYHELARKELINKLVLTRYDNRTQRIDNIDFDLTPATFQINDMSLMDYYLDKFDIQIKDPDQPLIVYCPRRPGETSVHSEANYLVPELCYLTGLSDRAHRDARARKTHHLFPLNSTDRQDQIFYFDDMIRRNIAAIKYLALWHIEMVANPLPIIGVTQVKSSSEESSDNEDEEKDIPDIEHTYGHFTSSVELNHWLLIYPKVDEDRAMMYVNMLRQVAHQQGMVISEPIYLAMEDDETETYARTLRTNLHERIQLVSLVVKSRRIDRYNTIKRICCLEIPTPTEIVLRSTISDDEILPGVALNIARDINLKLGGQIRPMNLALPNLMILSLATWTSSNVNYRSPEHLDYVLAVVGTINSNLNEYFSHAKSYTSEQDLRKDLGFFVRLALDAYYQKNQVYPSTIFLGRNVFSSLDNLRVIQDQEIQLILNTISNENPLGNYRPRLILFAYMKEMIYDFHQYVQPKKIANVDCLIAKESPSYVFYLSSHRDRHSTLQARQFLVLFDNTDLSAQKIQRMILLLTVHVPQRNHYFFPSVCRFAQRLATLVGETLGAPPRCDRYPNLFYL